MARGTSGKIVLEIEPSDKERLHLAVRRDGMTLKDWFLREMNDYLGRSVAAEETGAYKAQPKSRSTQRPKSLTKKRKATR
jgi:hypothetical protein